MIKQKKSFLLLTFFVAIVMCLAAGLMLAFGGKNKASYADDSLVEYSEVGTLEELEEGISSGTNKFTVTTSIAIEGEKTFSGLTFFLEPTAELTSVFTIASSSKVTFENCNIVSDSKWVLDSGFASDNKLDNNEFVVEYSVVTKDGTVENKLNYSFVEGNGEVNFVKTNIADVNTDKPFINIRGEEGELAKVNFVGGNVSHGAFEEGFLRGTFANVEVQKYAGIMTIENCFSRGNGSLFRVENGKIDIFGLKITKNNAQGNGFLSINNNSNELNESSLNVFDIEMSGNNVYPTMLKETGTHASMIHVYSGATLNFYGGKIVSNTDGNCVIGAHNAKKVNLYGGEISSNTMTYWERSNEEIPIDIKNGISVLLGLNTPVTIGQDMVINGKINTWGCAFENYGQVLGDIVVMEQAFSDCDDEYDKGEQSFTNYGYVYGDILLIEGTFNNEAGGLLQGSVTISEFDGKHTEGVAPVFNNKGIMQGNVTVKNGGTFNNFEDAEVYGDVSVAEEGVAKNDGIMQGNVQGQVTGDGEVIKPTTQKKNKTVTTVGIVLVVIFGALLVAFGVAAYMSKRKAK